MNLGVKRLVFGGFFEHWAFDRRLRVLDDVGNEHFVQLVEVPQLLVGELLLVKHQALQLHVFEAQVRRRDLADSGLLALAKHLPQLEEVVEVVQLRVLAESEVPSFDDV